MNGLIKQRMAATGVTHRARILKFGHYWEVHLIADGRRIGGLGTIATWDGALRLALDWTGQ